MSDPNQIQYVVMTCDDGTVLIYSGKAQVFEGQEKHVIKVVFSEPRTLPPHYHFEQIETPKGTG